jgi:lipopolysaccharide assembly protein A
MTEPSAGQPAPGMGFSAPGSPPEPPKRRISGRLVAGLILIVLLVIFGVENTRSVKMRLIIPEIRAPLFLALLIAAVVGVLIGLVIRRKRRPKNQRS